jgi:exodeoxyribonuclease VII small subunit
MSDAKRNAGDADEMDETPASGGTQSLSFEGALNQLEETVARLESGELPLEEALEVFEAGVRLSRYCSQTLEAAEKRIEILVADRTDASGDVMTEEFEPDDDFRSSSEEESEDFEE